MPVISSSGILQRNAVMSFAQCLSLIAIDVVQGIRSLFQFSFVRLLQRRLVGHEVTHYLSRTQVVFTPKKSHTLAYWKRLITGVGKARDITSEPVAFDALDRSHQLLSGSLDLMKVATSKGLKHREFLAADDRAI